MRSVEYLGILYIGIICATTWNFHVLNAVMHSEIAAVVPERITLEVVPECVIMDIVPECVIRTTVPERIP